jgi:hypothetical protein
MKLKYLLLLMCGCVVGGMQSQIRTNNSIGGSISTSTAFLDASSTPGWNSSTNVGKGLLFPRTNLVTLTALSVSGSPGIGNNYPTRMDGLIVYNTGTGTSAIGATSVTPGFYYYSNSTFSLNAGKWIRLSDISDLPTTPSGTTFPLTPKIGDVFYLTNAAPALNLLKVYNGSSWISVGVVNHDATLTGDGISSNLSLANDAVTTVKIADGNVTDVKIATGISASKVGLGNVNNTSDADKPISTATQAALDLKATVASVTNGLLLKLDATQKAVADGVATLDATGKVPSAQIPAISFSSTTVLADEASMLALSSAIKGDVVVRTDVSKNYILSALPASTLSNWVQLLTPAAPVQSVNGLLGTVSLTKADILLGNVDNTSDVNKPVSTAAQTALDLKENIANKSTVVTLGTSDVLYPTQKAVKTYVDDVVTLATVDADASTKGKLKLAGDLDGTAALPRIANSAVTTVKIADQNITAQKLSGITTNGNVGQVLSSNADGSFVWANGLVDNLPQSNIFIGDVSNKASAVPVTGDITISDLGVTTIGVQKVETGMLKNGTIINEDISPTAEIDLTKLVSGTSIVTSLATPAGSSPNGGSILNNALTLSLSNSSNPGLLSSADWNKFNLKVPEIRKVLTDNGIAGGGDLSLDRTLSLDINSLNSRVGTINNLDQIPIYDVSTNSVKKVTRADLLSGVTGAMIYQGTWDVTTNTPTLSDANGVQGKYYVLQQAGAYDFGSGSITFAQGDWVIYNGTKWEKLLNSVIVPSVYGRTGHIVAQAGDYTALKIDNAPAGNIIATNVQAAINELDNKKISTTLTTGNMIVGDINGKAASVKMKGDVTINDTCLSTIGESKVLTSMIANANVTTVKIAPQNVTVQKLAGITTNGLVGQVLSSNADGTLLWANALTDVLNDGKILLGDGLNKAKAVKLTGDVTVDNLGVTKLAGGAGTATVYYGVIASTSPTVPEIQAMSNKTLANGFYGGSFDQSTGSAGYFTIAIPVSWRTPALTIGGNDTWNVFKATSIVAIDDINYQLWQTDITLPSGQAVAIK